MEFVKENGSEKWGVELKNYFNNSIAPRNKEVCPLERRQRGFELRHCYSNFVESLHNAMDKAVGNTEGNKSKFKKWIWNCFGKMGENFSRIEKGITGQRGGFVLKKWISDIQPKLDANVLNGFTGKEEKLGLVLKWIDDLCTKVKKLSSSNVWSMKGKENAESGESADSNLNDDGKSDMNSVVINSSQNQSQNLEEIKTIEEFMFKSKGSDFVKFVCTNYAKDFEFLKKLLENVMIENSSELLISAFSAIQSKTLMKKSWNTSSTKYVVQSENVVDKSFDVDVDFLTCECTLAKGKFGGRFRGYCWHILACLISENKTSNFEKCLDIDSRLYSKVLNFKENVIAGRKMTRNAFRKTWRNNTEGSFLKLKGVSIQNPGYVDDMGESTDEHCNGTDDVFFEQNALENDIVKLINTKIGERTDRTEGFSLGKRKEHPFDLFETVSSKKMMIQGSGSTKLIKPVRSEMIQSIFIPSGILARIEKEIKKRQTLFGVIFGETVNVKSIRATCVHVFSDVNKFLKEFSDFDPYFSQFLIVGCLVYNSNFNTSLGDLASKQQMRFPGFTTISFDKGSFAFERLNDSEAWIDAKHVKFSHNYKWKYFED